jgi:hypothetical protein
MSAAAVGGSTLMSSSSASVQSTNPYTYRRNWGRWGADDQKGAVNLITPAKRAAAAALVKRPAVSLGRVFTPEQHYIRVNQRGSGNSVVDYYGFEYHGVAVTHVDALVHMWDRDGMWNGRDPAKEIDTNGVRFGDIVAFGDGLITRACCRPAPQGPARRHRQAGDRRRARGNRQGAERERRARRCVARLQRAGVVREGGRAIRRCH